MQVHELATRAAVAPHVVGYYARLGLLRRARDPRNKYKHFSQADLQRLAFIRKAKRLGFTPGGRPLTLGQFVYGLISAAVVSFAMAASLASFYNLFARASARS
jgi:hypothetical protein